MVKEVHKARQEDAKHGRAVAEVFCLPSELIEPRADDLQKNYEACPSSTCRGMRFGAKDVFVSSGGYVYDEAERALRAVFYLSVSPKSESLRCFLQDIKLFSEIFIYPIAHRTRILIYYALVRPIRPSASGTEGGR